jgi:ectoine hydroxylase-related dioxygenase (phytanoyl-CoA dioxygenase family)
VTLQSFVSTCKRDGFARIPSVFTLDEVNKLRAAAIVAMRGDSQVEIFHGYPTILQNPVNEYMQELSKDKRLTSVVSAYFGNDDYVLETQQYYFHLQGDPDEFAWHTDERFRPGAANLYLQTAIVVDPWTEESASVEFIKGSHKKPFENHGPLRHFVREGLKGDKLIAEPGDLLTWSNTVVHGSERNDGRHSRAYYMNGFRAKNDSYC